MIIKQILKQSRQQSTHAIHACNTCYFENKFQKSDLDNNYDANSDDNDSTTTTAATTTTTTTTAATTTTTTTATSPTTTLTTATTAATPTISYTKCLEKCSKSDKQS